MTAMLLSTPFSATATAAKTRSAGTLNPTKQISSIR